MSIFTKAPNDTAGIDNRVDRVFKLFKLADTTGSPVVLGEYEWLGTGVSVQVTMQEPGLVRTTIKPDPKHPSGDAGDQYNGLDRFSRLEDARWIDSEDADIERVEFGHDRLGNVVWRSNLVAPMQETPKYFDERYQYDTLYRLTGMTRGTLNQSRTAIGAIPAWSEGWQLDQAGNWLQYDTVNRQVTPVETLTQPRMFNAGNEITFLGGTNAVTAYDANGNMTVMPAVGDWTNSTPLVAQQLTWDAWNRLVRITKDDGTTLVGAYEYDGLGRRTRKTTLDEEDEEVVRDFYYDGSRIIEEWVHETEAAEREYVWGADGALLLRDTFTGEHEFDVRLYSIHDYRSVTAIYGISDSEWKVLNRIVYRAFGYSLMLDRDFDPTTDTGWEYRWNGWYWDGESGLELTRMSIFYHVSSGIIMQTFQVAPAHNGNLPPGWKITPDGWQIGPKGEKIPPVNFKPPKVPKPPGFTPLDCCREALAKGLFMAQSQPIDPAAPRNYDQGIVICCYGEKVACFELFNRPGWEDIDPEAFDLLWTCGLVHESTHFDDVRECEDGIEIYRPGGSKPRNDPTNEPAAYDAQVECLKLVRHKCKTESCRNQIDQEIENAQDAKAAF